MPIVSILSKQNRGPLCAIQSRINDAIEDGSGKPFYQHAGRALLGGNDLDLSRKEERHAVMVVDGFAE